MKANQSETSLSVVGNICMLNIVTNYIYSCMYFSLWTIKLLLDNDIELMQEIPPEIYSNVYILKYFILK